MKKNVCLLLIILCITALTACGQSSVTINTTEEKEEIETEIIQEFEQKTSIEEETIDEIIENDDEETWQQKDAENNQLLQEKLKKKEKLLKDDEEQEKETVTIQGHITMPLTLGSGVLSEEPLLGTPEASQIEFTISSEAWNEMEEIYQQMQQEKEISTTFSESPWVLENPAKMGMTVEAEHLSNLVADNDVYYNGFFTPQEQQANLTVKDMLLSDATAKMIAGSVTTEESPEPETLVPEETVVEIQPQGSTEGPLDKTTVEELMETMAVPTLEALVAIGEINYGMDSTDVLTLLHLVQFETCNEIHFGVHDYYYQYLGASVIINGYLLNNYEHHSATAMIAAFGGPDPNYTKPVWIERILNQPIYESTLKYTLLAMTHLFPGVYQCHGMTPENGYYHGCQHLEDAVYASPVWPGVGIWSATAPWYS